MISICLPGLPMEQCIYYVYVSEIMYYHVFPGPRAVVPGSEAYNPEVPTLSGAAVRPPHSVPYWTSVPPRGPPPGMIPPGGGNLPPQQQYYYQSAAHVNPGLVTVPSTVTNQGMYD